MKYSPGDEVVIVDDPLNFGLPLDHHAIVMRVDLNTLELRRYRNSRLAPVHAGFGKNDVWQAAWHTPQSASLAADRLGRLYFCRDVLCVQLLRRVFGTSHADEWLVDQFHADGLWGDHDCREFFVRRHAAKKPDENRCRLSAALWGCVPDRIFGWSLVFVDDSCCVPLGNRTFGGTRCQSSVADEGSERSPGIWQDRKSVV